MRTDRSAPSACVGAVPWSSAERTCAATRARALHRGANRAERARLHLGVVHVRRRRRQVERARGRWREGGAAIKRRDGSATSAAMVAPLRLHL